jgi:hypothetical protein
VHQGGGLESVIRAFTPEIAGSPLPQFSIHERQQVIACVEVPVAPRPE